MIKILTRQEWIDNLYQEYEEYLIESLYGKNTIDTLEILPDYMGITSPSISGIVAAYLPNQNIILINKHGSRRL
jgi:hypothetical protein